MSVPKISIAESAMNTRASAKRPTSAIASAALAFTVYLAALVVQRAHYEPDPWSGQIAFPGGAAEAGEPLESAAMASELPPI